MTDTLDRKRSVTAEDQNTTLVSGDVVSIVFAPASWGQALAQQFNANLSLGLPPRRQFNRSRDALLRGTLEMDAMWGAAVTKATAKQVALGWLVDDEKDIRTRARVAQELIELYDGDWETGISRGYQDYNLTDNGQWIEIIRATKGAGSRVTGLAHLDSLRVVRTGDPEIPGIYTTLQGREKPLYAHQVINITAMPSPDAALYGLGLCPASVAWSKICTMMAIETYFHEKVTGRNNKAVHLIRGINYKQLKNALDTAENDNIQKGNVYYRGAIMIPGLDATEEISVTTIDLASIPDAFDIEQERARADNVYANAIGIFVGELRPLTGQGLGNGQQAALLEEQAEVSQMAAWRKQLTTALKRNVLPRTTVFRWSTNDAGDRRRKAEADAAVVGWLAVAVEKLGMSPTAAQQVLLDNKIIPAELAAADVTPGGTLTDEEQAPTNEPTGEPFTAPAPPAAVAQKAAPAVDVDGVWDAALSWARLALADEGA